MSDKLWIAVNAAGVPDLATLHVDESSCFLAMDEIGLVGFEARRCMLVIHNPESVDAAVEAARRLIEEDEGYGAGETEGMYIDAVMVARALLSRET